MLDACYHHTIYSGRRLSLLSLLILTIQTGFTQDNSKRFESISVSDGLVQSSVIDIASDEYGYVWVGTYGGLSRFDGSEFTNFYHDPEDSTSLSNSSVWSLKSTGDGKMWIGTSDGLNTFDWAKEHFVQYKDPELTGRVIRKIAQWSADTLILETPRGIYFFDIPDESFFQMSQFDSFNEKNVLLQVKKDGSMFLYCDGMIHLITKNKSEKRLKISNNVRAIYSDSNDNIWIMTDEDLRLISSDFTQTKIISKESYFGHRIKFTEDNYGKIYLINGDVRIYNLEGQLLERHVHEPDKEFSLLTKTLSTIHIAKNGILWIGTAGYGMNRYDPKKPSIEFLGNQPRYTPSLSDSYVTSFFTQDDNTVFIGTASSLDVFDIRKATVKSIFPERVDLLQYHNGSCWGAAKGKIFAIDIEQEEVDRTIPIDNLSNTRTMRGFDDRYLWIGSSLGLTKLDLITEKKQHFLSPPDTIKGRDTGDWITSIFKMDDQLLLGTSWGLFSLNLSTETVFPVKNPVLSSLKNSFIKFIESSDNRIIWIGTSGDGLYRWDRISNSIKHFTRKHGLPNDVTYGILQDEKGLFWISTNYGLSRFNDKSNEFVNLDINYGLQSNEFNTSAYFKSPNGVFYFGGVKGLNYFHPDLVENPINPDTHITGFYLSNQRTSPAELGISSGAIMDVDTLILDYKQNMLSFDFKCSNFTISDLNQYAYYLENLEDDWNYVGNRRFANYSSLLPGKYIFKVKSANNNGLWDNTPDQIVIIIKEPYWQTTWFKTLIALIVLIIILSIAGLRIKALKGNELKLKQLVNARTKSLRTINSELKKTILEKELTQQKLIQSEKMAALGTLSAGVGHEINNPLNIINQALVSLRAELNENGMKEPQKLTTYMNFINDGVERAAKIVKSLSNFSRLGISYKEDCTIEFIIDDCLVLLNSKMSGKVEVIKNYKARGISIEGNAGKLHQVFFNLLANAEQAIEERGSITISTFIEEGNFMFEIVDTGKGMSSEVLNQIFNPFFTTKEQGEGTGLGLSITHTIIEEHKGKIKVESELNKGTIFTISLPMD